MLARYWASRSFSAGARDASTTVPTLRPSTSMVFPRARSFGDMRLPVRSGPTEATTAPDWSTNTNEPGRGGAPGSGVSVQVGGSSLLRRPMSRASGSKMLRFARNSPCALSIMKRSKAAAP